jgi:hypothetical protein
MNPLDIKRSSFKDWGEEDCLPIISSSEERGI